MSDGLLYEPRSFWSIGTFGSSEGLTSPSTISLNRQHFYNGERWPVQINRIAVAGINYTFVRPPDVISAYQAGSATINAIRIRVSAPQRYHYSTQRTFELAAIGPLPTWTPSAKLATTIVEGDPIAFRPSSLWGQCALKFDNPLYIPRTTALEWDISSYTPWANTAGPAPQPQEALTVPTCYQLYEEPGGLLSGNARTRSFQMHAYDQPTVPQDEGWPFLRDMFQPVVAGQPLATSDWWHPDGRFNVRQFDLQEATRAGSTQITGMRTMIDQIVYDAFLFDDDVGEGSLPCPLSMRVGTRVRLANSGSQTWWWRPGAPLCLVFDHITPASVYQLHEPITIGPGDTLDVQMEFPPASPAPSSRFARMQQFGISFNGFAAIEG